VRAEHEPPYGGAHRAGVRRPAAAGFSGKRGARRALARRGAAPSARSPPLAAGRTTGQALFSANQMRTCNGAARGKLALHHLLDAEASRSRPTT
jgi:hypothetical protein